MTITEIVAQLDQEIARLQEAKAILGSISPLSIKRKPGRPSSATSTALASALAQIPAPTQRRVLSAAARKKIAAAQKKRWSKARLATPAPAPKAAATPLAKPTPKPTSKPVTKPATASAAKAAPAKPVAPKKSPIKKSPAAKPTAPAKTATAKKTADSTAPALSN